MSILPAVPIPFLFLFPHGIGTTSQPDSVPDTAVTPVSSSGDRTGVYDASRGNFHGRGYSNWSGPFGPCPCLHTGTRSPSSRVRRCPLRLSRFVKSPRRSYDQFSSEMMVSIAAQLSSTVAGAIRPVSESIAKVSARLDCLEDDPFNNGFDDDDVMGDCGPIPDDLRASAERMSSSGTTSTPTPPNILSTALTTSTPLPTIPSRTRILHAMVDVSHSFDDFRYESQIGLNFPFTDKATVEGFTLFYQGKVESASRLRAFRVLHVRNGAGPITYATNPATTNTTPAAAPRSDARHTHPPTVKTGGEAPA